MVIVAHEWDVGYTAGEMGWPKTPPHDCTCRRSWLAGYAEGLARRRLRGLAK